MKPTAEQAREIAEKYFEDFEFVGICTQDQPFWLGEIDHSSLLWDDCITIVPDEEIGRISATDCRNAADIERHLDEHVGENVAIVAGHSMELGYSPCEIIIENAVCVHIF